MGQSSLTQFACSEATRSMLCPVLQLSGRRSPWSKRTFTGPAIYSPVLLFIGHSLLPADHILHCLIWHIQCIPPFLVFSIVVEKRCLVGFVITHVTKMWMAALTGADGICTLGTAPLMQTRTVQTGFYSFQLFRTYQYCKNPIFSY